MNTALNWDSEAGANLVIVYDGDCPFCSSYVGLLRLRQAAGTVRLVDARSDDPVAHCLMQAGYDLDEGMAAIFGGRVYHGADCIHLLGLLGTRSGLFNRLNGWMFRSPTMARVIYPMLRCGRNLALRMLGRGKIKASPVK